MEVIAVLVGLALETVNRGVGCAFVVHNPQFAVDAGFDVRSAFALLAGVLVDPEVWRFVLAIKEPSGDGICSDRLCHILGLGEVVGAHNRLVGAVSHESGPRFLAVLCSPVNIGCDGEAVKEGFRLQHKFVDELAEQKRRCRLLRVVFRIAEFLRRLAQFPQL